MNQHEDSETTYHVGQKVGVMIYYILKIAKVGNCGNLRSYHIGRSLRRLFVILVPDNNIHFPSKISSRPFLDQKAASTRYLGLTSP